LDLFDFKKSDSLAFVQNCANLCDGSSCDGVRERGLEKLGLMKNGFWNCANNGKNSVSGLEAIFVDCATIVRNCTVYDGRF
jgi:hypothetical protein